ncbi:MAG: hypothetical protein LBS21_02170 [Clostridiales bacterium]|nr:hypothetical protein [Clostridiales bacterium]
MAAGGAGNRIKITSNIPGLEEKIQKNLSGSTENIFWYIKFNIPLNEESVSEKTMNVTDTDGYIMRTDISYDDSRNLILISPLDTYEQDVYYVLRISKKVKSLRGNNLKQEMYILFKLMNNQISEFKTLKSNVKVPAVKKRPPNYDVMFREKIQTMSRVYSFTDKPFQVSYPNRLPTAPLQINIWVAVAGVLLMVVYALARSQTVLILGIMASVAGIIHLFAQLSRKSVRSVIAYNKGANKFNKDKFQEANACFVKAQALDPENEMAEYATNKMTFYK